MQYKNWRAHRLSYSLYYGPIPKGLMICHTCDNILCVNPNHLFVGTNSDNQLDASEKGITSGENSHSSILTSKQIQDMIFKIISGKFSNIFEISNFYNISHHTIRDIIKGKTWKNDFERELKKMNISRNSLKNIVLYHFKGENHVHSKLSDDDVFDIKKRIKNMEKIKDIAGRYNVSTITIQNIKNGKIWKDI